MKPEELRIGNYILDYGQICQVNGFLLTRLEEIHREGKEPINTSRIPISEEWLIKLGFEKESGNKLRLHSYDLEFRKTDDPYPTVGIWKGRFYYIVDVHETYTGSLDDKSIEIDYVHQLQNLYYSLTGEKLTIK